MPVSASGLAFAHAAVATSALCSFYSWDVLVAQDLLLLASLFLLPVPQHVSGATPSATCAVPSACAWLRFAYDACM